MFHWTNLFVNYSNFKFDQINQTNFEFNRIASRFNNKLKEKNIMAVFFFLQTESSQFNRGEQIL